MPRIPQPDADWEHLRILAIFHYIIGAFSLFGLAFLGLHFMIMRTMVLDPAHWQKHQTPDGPPPEFMAAAFQWIYIFFGALSLASAVMNLISGNYLLKRRCHTFCMITAGFNCIQFPFGTALGVFTIIVLSRHSVRHRYASVQQAPRL